MTTTTGIDSERVDGIFRDCLFKEGEDTSRHVKAQGITMNVRFHPERLGGHKAEIEAMLDQLPDEFKRSGGGGMSFLNACMDRHGNTWTSLHRRMEQLFLLGLAVNKVELLTTSPDLLRALPGGMPYYVVN